MSGRSIYRIAWGLLNREFRPGGDDYKGVSKEIHNAALEAGWVLVEDRRARDERIIRAAVRRLCQQGALYSSNYLTGQVDYNAIIAAAEAET